MHSDIGGGYPEKQSALSKYPLLWMIEEAVKHGLKVDRRTVNQLGWGRKRKGSPFDYVAPDYLPYPDNPASRDWQPHDSMNAGWRLLEVIPKKDKYKEWPKRKSMLGYYIPDCRAAADSRGRADPSIRARQDRAGQELPAGQHPLAVHGGAARTPPAAGMADDAGDGDEA